jgi:hypothetical protein
MPAAAIQQIAKSMAPVAAPVVVHDAPLQEDDLMLDLGLDD